MRSSKSRSRNKSNRQRSIGNIINRVFDSSGPEGKVRGTPQQIIDKYLALARDAQLGNDRVAEQNFLQHAEHYTRMLGEAQREIAREQEERQRNFQQNGGPQGNRDRSDRYDREAEQPRFDAGDAAADAFVSDDMVEDRGTGLVETPEMRSASQDSANRPAADFARPDAGARKVADIAPAAAPVAEPAPIAEPRVEQAPVAETQPGEDAAVTAPEGEATARPPRPRARRTPRKPRAPKADDSASLPLDAQGSAASE